MVDRIGAHRGGHRNGAGGRMHRPAQNGHGQGKPNRQRDPQRGLCYRDTDPHPTRAASVLPTIADQGCASGLFGTAKRRTAVAPKGATR